MVDHLCLASFFIAFALAAALTPLMRALALRWGILDHPATAVKTHREPTPYLGGLAIFLGIAGSLLLMRLFTHFPTGTLRSLRALLIGGLFLALVGLVDDMKAGGMNFRWKFLFQFIGAGLLIFFDIRLKFIQPEWLAGPRGGSSRP